MNSQAFKNWFESWREKLSKFGQPAISEHDALLAQQALDNLLTEESDPKEVL